jgi:hypothetical protein
VEALIRARFIYFFIFRDVFIASLGINLLYASNGEISSIYEIQRPRLKSIKLDGYD